MGEVSIRARTDGSSTKFSKQWPPLRTAMRLPSRTARWTAATTCSVVLTTYTWSGLPTKRPLEPRRVREA